MTTEIAVTNEAPKLQEQAGALTQTVAALQVVDGATFTEAGEMLKTVTAYIKRVGEVFDPIVSAAHQAHQVAVRQRAGLLQPAEAAKRTLGGRMAEYQQEQERIRRAAEEAARREQERLQREENQRAEAERRRLQREADDRAQAEALAAAEAGDRELAERIIAAPVVVEAAPMPVFVPPVAVQSAPKVAGVSFRDNWSAEVTDFAALVRAVAAGSQPITLLEPNMVALNGMARSLKEGLAIPGVRAKNDRTTSARA